jgi:capsular polysaccharide biosynthesis protein
VTSTRDSLDSTRDDDFPFTDMTTAPHPHRRDNPGATLRDVLLVIGRSWFIIVAAVAAALVGAGIITAVTPESYETKAAVLVIPAVSGDAVSMAQAASFVADQVETYAALAETPAVLDPAIERSGAGVASTELVDAVDSELIPGTSIITLTVSSGSAREAAELANAIAASLIEQIEEQTPADGAVRVTGSVVESPEIPTDPASPNLLINLLFALAVGLVVAFLAIVFRQALSPGVHDL